MVRNYRPDPIAPSLLSEVLEEALMIPTAGHSQGISLVVIEEPARRRAIADLANESQWVERGFPAWLSTAPVHIVPCLEPEVYHRRYQRPDKSQAVSSQHWPVPYWVMDGGACFMVLLLAAEQRGLAAGFQGVHNLPGLETLLNLPVGVQPLGVVTLGYASEIPAPARTARPPRRSGRIHRERWVTSEEPD